MVVGVLVILLGWFVAAIDYESVNAIGAEEVINHAKGTVTVFGDERAGIEGEYAIRDEDGSDFSGEEAATVWLIDSDGELVEPVFQGTLRHAKRYVRNEKVLFIGSLADAEAWEAAQREANIASWWKEKMPYVVAIGVPAAVFIVLGLWPSRRLGSRRR